LATAVLHYAAAAVTDRGRKRPSNEDAFGFSVEHGVYVVCDGMGGAAAGEIASSLAVDEVLNLFAERADDEARTLQAAAEQAVQAANAVIYSRAQRNVQLNGMGTTLVGLVTDERRALVVNVGDSRCYLLRDNSLKQLTLDHSLVEEQVRLGRMTRSEATRSPLRNVITRALGTQRNVTADFFEIEAQPGDLYLLCSDGLTRELANDKIESLLRDEMPLDEICLSLTKAANKAGGHDNITCVLVKAEE
jgi:protein phosphatase